MDGDGDLQIRRAQACVDLLGAVADESPLVLLIDDLHWADAASVRTLDLALARLPRGPVFVVATSRYPSKALGFGDAVGTLSPLSLQEMEGLVSSIAEVTDDAASLLGEPLHAASGGSPFSALRLLQEANARALVRVENNRWGVVDPVALRALFQRAQTAAGRLSDLGREPLGLLMALAMMDEPLSMRQLKIGRAHV